MASFDDTFIHTCCRWKNKFERLECQQRTTFSVNNPMVGLQFVIFLLYIICCKTYRYQNLYSIAFRASKLISNEPDEIHLMLKIFGVNNDIYLSFYFYKLQEPCWDIIIQLRQDSFVYLYFYLVGNGVLWQQIDFRARKKNRSTARIYLYNLFWF